MRGFKPNQLACVNAWWVYCVLRYFGLVNHPHDLIIILFLFVVMVITVFYTFGRE